MSVTAEIAYLFRHAVTRDAAYELQTPSQRRELHGLALEIMERLYGCPPDETGITARLAPHPLDQFAGELVVHARQAGDDRRRRLYLVRAGLAAEKAFRHGDALAAWSELESVADAPYWRLLAGRCSFAQAVPETR